MGLGLERLEARLVLSGTPSISFETLDPAAPNEGDTVQVSFEFTDAVSGGDAIGLNPADFTSIGVFNTDLWDTADPVDVIQSITIDTGVNGDVMSAPQMVVTYLDATLTPQVVTFTGVTTPGDSGDPDGSPFEIAVFTFNDFNLGAGQVVAAAGGRPVALLSQGAMTIAGVIDASAKYDPTGDFGNERLPGPGGGMGGVLATGIGSAAAGAPEDSGGRNPFYGSGSSGGGGGFGGDGGRHAENLPFDDPSGVFGRGFAYGDLANAIQGGSGGGGGSIVVFGSPFYADGGGGGGGVELGAVTTLTITATGSVLADGGDGEQDAFSLNANGGGGAGGGILVHAADVAVAGTLSAQGGNGGAYAMTGIPTGGGGGGGRILVVDNDNVVEAAIGNVSGGLTGFAPAAPGNAGFVAFEEAEPVATPQLYEFVINWGDGATSNVSVTATGGGTFLATHAYADDGIYAVEVSTSSTVTPTSTSFSIDVNNVAPANLLLGSVADIDENGTAVLNLTFDDPGVEDLHTFTIDWGDGSAAETFTIGVGERTAQFTHQYLDDAPSGTPSDAFSISVTLDDGDGGSASATTSVTVHNVGPEILSLSNSSASFGGAHEGQTVFLSGSYFDVGALDAHTASIDWGDGGGPQVVAQSGGVIAASHTYAQGGFYTVVYTLIDDDSGQAVESTLTVIAGVGLHNGVLQIIGTNSRDEVEVLKQSATLIKVKYDLGSQPEKVRSNINAASVTEIQIYLGDGDDYAQISNNVVIDATIFGGDGCDLLIGGGGNDVLIGGDGADILLGGAGSDLLIGGACIDLLFGEDNGDVVIGGDTTLDIDFDALSDFMNVQAKLDQLDAALAAWTTTQSYDVRKANVIAKLDGHVFDDNAIDLLSGGADHDLFFRGDCGWLGDLLVDRSRNEYVVELDE